MPDTEKLVTLTRLKMLLDAYGATLEFWPEEERAAATALIDTSAEARMLVEESAALDALLDKIPEPEVSAALTSRIRSMALPAAEANAGGWFARMADYFRPQSPRGWQGAVAMAGVVGMVAGIGVSQLALNKSGPTPQVVAVSAPVTRVAATLISDASTSEETNTASLAPNLNTYSLTGEDISDNTNDDSNDVIDNTGSEPQSDSDEFTIASVPLY
jgi:hypothetical protein